MIRRFAFAAAALALAATGTAAQAPLPGADYFVGRWGKVAFNDDRDLGRMIGVARGFCGNLAYPIRRIGGDVFEMFVGDQQAPVRVVQQDGRLFIARAVGEGIIAGGARELTIRDRNVFTVRYIDQSYHSRYGANVFVRCGAAQREARPRAQQSEQGAADATGSTRARE